MTIFGYLGVLSPLGGAPTYAHWFVPIDQCSASQVSTWQIAFKFFMVLTSGVVLAKISRHGSSILACILPNRTSRKIHRGISQGTCKYYLSYIPTRFPIELFLAILQVWQ